MTELHHYTTQFYATKQDQGRSPETLRHYRFHIERFLAWCNQQGYHGNDFYGVAGAEVIEEYQAQLRASGISPMSMAGKNWLFRYFDDPAG